jgi:hypothetical protein
LTIACLASQSDCFVTSSAQNCVSWEDILTKLSYQVIIASRRGGDHHLIVFIGHKGDEPLQDNFGTYHLRLDHCIQNGEVNWNNIIKEET